MDNQNQPNSQGESNFFIRLVNACTKNSEYTLNAGAPSQEFFDIDDGIIDPMIASNLSDIMCDKIIEIKNGGKEFDKLAFIEKATGPVGLLSLLTAILSKIKMETVIIRPYKLLIRDTVKGDIKRGDRVLILNDVATTGETIFEAAEKIWLMGGLVVGAVVVIDRLQGGAENLKRKGIELFHIKTTKEINEMGSEIKRPFHLSAPIMRDFGGTSTTFAS